MASLKEKIQAAAAKVESCKEALKTAQSDFDALFRQAVMGRVKKPKAGGENAEFELASTPNPESSIEQISALLKSEPNKEWNYSEINSRLPSVPRASVRVFLYKLKKDEKAEKTGRGKWKAK